VLALGAALLALAVEANKSDGQVALPDWTVKALTAFGIILLVIAFLGLYGAHQALNKIANEKRNYFLWLYFIIVGAAFIVQLIAAAVLLTRIGVIKNAKAQDKSDEAAVTFEAELVDFLRKHATEWIDIQDAFECCGYNTTSLVGPNSDLSTGKYCTQDRPLDGNGKKQSVFSCKNKVMDKAIASGRALAVFGIIFGVVQFIAVISAFCLICCVDKNQVTSYR